MLSNPISIYGFNGQSYTPTTDNQTSREKQTKTINYQLKVKRTAQKTGRIINGISEKNEFGYLGGKAKKYPLRMESEQSELRGSKSLKKKILSCPTMKG